MGASEGVEALLIGAKRPSECVPAAAKQTGRHQSWKLACVVYQLAAFGLQNNKKGVKNDSAKPENRSPRVQL